MEKLLIHLYVPALVKDYDLFVPQDVPIRTVTLVIENGVRELSVNRYTPSGKAFLLLQGGAAPLDPEKTLADYGVQDGENLLLV